MNREEWLSRAIEGLRPDFDRVSHPVPAVVRVSVGFPSRGGTSSSHRRIGECWHPEACEDGAPQVFISPLLVDPVDVLAVLVHEVIHAGGAKGHRSAFTRPMRALGLGGKPTATTAGDMAPRLHELADSLGTYPHAKLTPSAAGKQSTRMLKVECPCCGYTVRTTQKWLDVGVPRCPDGTPMRLA